MVSGHSDRRSIRRSRFQHLNRVLYFRLARTFCVALLLSVAIAACTDDEISPEDEIKAYIAAAEAAAEARSVGALRELIAEDYRDAEGQTRKDVTGLARFYFLRQQSLHVFTRIDNMEFPNSNTALVGVYAAMGGSSMESVGMLDSLRADMVRFDLILERRNGEWLLVEGKWGRAAAGDFL